MLAGREGDSCRSIFVDNPPTLMHLHKLKGKYLTPFVQARLCTCSRDKVTTRVGSPKDVQVIVDKLSANSCHTFTKKEDSLLLQAFLNRSTVDLTLKTTHENAENEEEGADAPSSAAPATMHSCFDNPELLAGVVDCVVNLEKCVAIVTAGGRSQRDGLVRMIRIYLARFKKYTLQGVSQLANHWTIAAFEGRSNRQQQMHDETERWNVPLERANE